MYRPQSVCSKRRVAVCSQLEQINEKYDDSIIYLFTSEWDVYA